MKKRLLSLVLAVCLVFSLAPAVLAVSTADFSDLEKGAWYYPYVDTVVKAGYFNGVSTTTFAPDDLMTRAMFVTVLSRMDGAQVDNSKTAFSDVPVGSWYTGAVTWAAENKIVIGVGGNLYDPEAPITREQMCLIMQRYITYYAAKTGKAPVSVPNNIKFTDVSKLDAASRLAVSSCVSYGLVNGYPDGTFQPYGNATRAEVAAVVSRLAWRTTGGGTVNEYMIVYDTNYPDALIESGLADAQRSEIGRPVRNFSELWTVPEGWRFTGWSTSEDGPADLTYAPGQRVYADTTLYAQWEEVEPEVEDHINVAVTTAVGQANAEAQRLYKSALDEIKGIIDDQKLKDEIEKVTGKTSVEIKKTGKYEITVTLETAATDANVRSLARFAADYALEMFRGHGTAQEDAQDLLARVKENLKKLLTDLGIDYSGNGWKEKIDTAAQSLTDKVKEKAATYRDALKAIFKNVNADDLTQIVTGGTTSVTAAKIEANNTEIITVNKDTKLTRETVKAAATKAHEAVQLAAGDQYISLDDLATKEITGKITFTPADTISGNYDGTTADYSKEYTVKFNVTTGTDNYLQYKYDNSSDYYKVVLTDEIQAAYTEALHGTINTIWEKLVESGKIKLDFTGGNAQPANLAPYSIMVMAAQEDADPGANDKSNLFDAMRKAFAQLDPDADVNPVDEALEQWIKDNSGVGDGTGFTDSAIFDILTGEGDVDPSKLDNSAFNGLIDQMAEALGEKLYEENSEHRKKAFNFDDVETLMGAALDKYKDDPAKQEFVEFFDDYSEREEYAGLFAYVEAKAGDVANQKLKDAGKLDDEELQKLETPLVDTPYDGTNYKKNPNVNGKAPTETLKDSIDSAVKENASDMLQNVVEENETVKKLQEYLKKIKNNDTLQDAENVTVNRAIEELTKLKEMAGDLEINLDSYMGRITSAASRLNSAINKVLNSRFGTQAKKASIKIGTNGTAVTVENINNWLDEVAKAQNIDGLITKLSDAASNAHVGELSLSSFYGEGQVITATYGSYTYSFHLVAELPKAA